MGSGEPRSQRHARLMPGNAMIRVTRRDLHCEAGTNLSAYRTVTIPVLDIEVPVAGPTVALIAGVHGDEWEGQVAMQWLWHQLPGMLRRGRVLLIPAANPSASRAGNRMSPEDGGNLNRAFVDAPARGYTETIAAAIEQGVLPLVSCMVDVHSGGRSLHYLPSTVITRYAYDPPDDKAMAMARAFGLPACLFFRTRMAGSMQAAASRLGVSRLSAEIGGGAQTSEAASMACRDGLLRCLAALGMLEFDGGPPQPEPALFDLSPPEATLRATADGVFVPAALPGAMLRAGETLGQYVEPTAPWLPAETIVAPRDGVLLCHRAIARSHIGDCLVQVAPQRALSSLPELY